MNTADKIYLDLLQDIIDNGHDEPNSRTGVGTRAVFGRQLCFNMRDGLPLLTTKKMFTKGIIYELLWFMGNHLNDPKYRELGRTSAKFLIDNEVEIWTGDLYKRYLAEFAKVQKENINGFMNPWLLDNGSTNAEWIELDEQIEYSPLTIGGFSDCIRKYPDFAKLWADCGPIYGKQWTEWTTSKLSRPVNQLKNAIEKLKNNPTDRRIMVSAWNVSDIEVGKMILPPCHYGFTFFTRLLTLDERIKLADNLERFDVFDFGVGPVSDEHCHGVCDAYKIPRRALSLKWNQRSVDTALGLPFNIASYAILLEMMAKEVGMIPEDLVASLENTHIYTNQMEGVKEHLTRKIEHGSPELWLNPEKSIFEYNYEDIKILDYKSLAKINIPLSN